MLRSGAVFIFLFLLAGCSTVRGPDVTREEIAGQTNALRIQAFQFQVRQLNRLYGIARRLEFAVQPDDLKRGRPGFRPYLGIVCAELNPELRQLYGIQARQGLVAIIIDENGPARRSGANDGDLILSIDGRPAATLRQFNKCLAALRPGVRVDLTVMRSGKPFTLLIEVSRIPFEIPIALVPQPEVNAATDGNVIAVTYGLMNFARSDDEIAAVLGHEMAHAVRGHAAKVRGAGILKSAAATIAGIAANTQIPGIGSVVSRGVGSVGGLFQASYSRDLEREADYFGTKFVYNAGFDAEACAQLQDRLSVEVPGSMIQGYFSTHPSSPERAARIRKTIAGLSGNPAS